MSEYIPYKGMPPSVAGSATSEAAAASMAPHTPTLRNQILAAFKTAGDHGFTNDELVVKMGIDIPTVCARVRELVLMGHVLETKWRRPTRSGRSAVVKVWNDPRQAFGQAFPLFSGVGRP